MRLPELLAVGGILIIVTSLINAVFVRLATRLVAGFTPDYRTAFVAAFGSQACFTAAAFFAGMIGAALGYRPNPQMLAVILTVGFLLTLFLYAQVLQDRHFGEIGVSRALAVFVLQTLVSSLIWIGAELLWKPDHPLSFRSQFAVWFPPNSAVVADAQRAAVRSYPELGVEGSRLNAEFLRRHRRYQVEQPRYFQDPSWPIRLARESHQAVYGRYLAGGSPQTRVSQR